MNKTFSILYNNVNIINISVKIVNGNTNALNKIDVVSTIFARGYGKMIKEITAKFLLSNTIKGGTIDKFIEDVVEMDALKETPFKEKTNIDELVINNKIIPLIREKYENFVKNWDRYFEGTLSWNEI